MNASKIPSQIARVLLVLALMFSITSPASAKGKGLREKVAWADVPRAVQATIRENSAGGEIVAVEKRTKRGVISYDAEVKRADGKILGIEVAPDGKLISVEVGEPDSADE
ncbi:MAG TPA: hypothetical protein VF551_04630 [Chthoniobacterales bacterium]